MRCLRRRDTEELCWYRSVPSVVSPALSLANRALVNYMRTVLALEVAGETPVVYRRERKHLPHSLLTQVPLALV